MKLEKYLQSLLPNFERSRVESDIESTIDIIEKTVVPSWNKAITALKDRELRSTDGVEFAKSINQRFQNYRTRTPLLAVVHNFATIVVNLRQISGQLDSLFENDITRESLTYRGLSALQYVQTASFVADYSTSLLARLLSAEAGRATESVPPNVKRWYDSNREVFYDSLSTLSVNPKQFNDRLGQAPDTRLDPNGSGLTRLLAGTNSDPFRFNFIAPASWNPLYQIRLSLAEYQVKKFKAKEEERRMLELQILDLTESLNNQADAKVQQQIEYSQGRLNRLNYELQELTAHYRPT